MKSTETTGKDKGEAAQAGHRMRCRTRDVGSYSSDVDDELAQVCVRCGDVDDRIAQVTAYVVETPMTKLLVTLSAQCQRDRTRA